MTGALSSPQKAALVRTDGTFQVSLYKVFLFQLVTTAIKSGDLNVEQSYKYRPMDAYLIKKERWQQEKIHFLERANLTEFAYLEPVLARRNVALSAQYRAANDRAVGNPHLKLRKDKTYHIATPALDYPWGRPVRRSFPPTSRRTTCAGFGNHQPSLPHAAVFRALTVNTCAAGNITPRVVGREHGTGSRDRHTENGINMIQRHGKQTGSYHQLALLPAKHPGRQ